MSAYPEGADVKRNVTLSQDDAHRYTLTRAWDTEGSLFRIVMLHPPKDDAMHDDATISRCVKMAVRLGHVGLIVYNVYALRADRQTDLWREGVDPIGPANDAVIMQAASDAAQRNAYIVAAWGAGAKEQRIKHVMAMTDGVRWASLGPPMPSGNPRHPLYYPDSAGNAILEPWPPKK